MATVDKSDISGLLGQLRQTATQLAQTSATVRSQALATMGDALTKQQDALLEANTLDLEISREMAVPEAVTDWLKLTPERVSRAASILHRLAAIGETVGSWGNSGQGSAEVVYVRPLGIVALIYEAFPELGAIAAGLCLQTGNALVLKGGNESSQTNHALVNILQAAIAQAGLSPQSLLFIPPERSEVLRSTLVRQPEIDLVIPYGRPQLVEELVQQATVPILPTRMGNCYLCWCPSAEAATVYHMIVDSHRGEPDAVNSIEKVIVVGDCSDMTLVHLWSQLLEAGFELRAEEALMPLFGALRSSRTADWQRPYLRRTVAFRRAATLADAVAWANQYSSGHADSVATTSYAESRQFIATIRSASVYLNTSPRFARNPKESAAIALGMSNQAGRTGGVVGINALMSAQRIVHATFAEPR
ncbi:MAG: aldehyde dehydrogenase family protein [Leptolyngbya sp. SIO4C1]|nr:aldehyde dehydrogenase family protein [Leptolyngbya sp. SIO4C1]